MKFVKSIAIGSLLLGLMGVGGAAVLVLGPEPLIAAQRLQLLQGDRRLSLGTDGLAPFAVLPEGTAP